MVAVFGGPIGRRDDVIDNQWDNRIGCILETVPYLGRQILEVSYMSQYKQWRRMPYSAIIIRSINIAETGNKNFEEQITIFLPYSAIKIQ